MPGCVVSEDARLAAAEFFEAGPEFWLDVVEPRSATNEILLENWPRWVGTATYVGEDEPQSEREVRLRFELENLDDPLVVALSRVDGERISLRQGSAYDVAIQVLHGWPSTFGLMIGEGDELVFEGVSDWQLGKQISVGTLSPFEVRQERMLEDHFQRPEACWEQITNTEIGFTLGESSLTLHQGESGVLGAYEIRLAVAREVEYSKTNTCLDAGLNQISYSISRMPGK